MVAEILTTAGIPHQASGTQAGFDIASIGRADVPADILITVESQDYSKARHALEEALAESELPEGHFLCSASNDDILDMLASPGEWSSFDIAQAQKLARQRNLSLEHLHQKQSEHVAAAMRGKPAPTWLLVLGWSASLLGGVIGIGIGYSLAYMKEQTPEGGHFTYDEPSRKAGRYMLGFSLFMLVAVRLWWVTYGSRR